MQRACACLVLWLKLVLGLNLVACGEAATDPERVQGLTPVGEQAASDAALARFVRRASLDLHGRALAEADVTKQVAKLSAAPDPGSARGQYIKELMGALAFAEHFSAELQARAFAGQSPKQRFPFACLEVAVTTPACAACSNADPCTCACDAVKAVVAQNQAIETAAAIFAKGKTTSELERMFAASAAVYAGSFGDPQSRGARIFQVFLGREPEPEERENAGALMQGPIVNDPAGGIVQRASGALFGREGKDASDLVEILFASEVYREAVVRSVFDRYLGREPNPAELGHFSRELAADNPDARATIAAVLSSSEYFSQ